MGRGLLVTFLLVAGGAELSAHVKLVRANPVDGALLTVSPVQVQLWFNEAPLLGMSGGTLTGPKGGVALGRVRVGPDRSLVLPIPAVLEPGAYQLEWRTAGEDGHVIRGVIGFSLKATPLAPK